MKLYKSFQPRGRLEP